MFNNYNSSLSHKTRNALAEYCLSSCCYIGGGQAQYFPALK